MPFLLRIRLNSMTGFVTFGVMSDATAQQRNSAGNSLTRCLFPKRCKRKSRRAESNYQAWTDFRRADWIRVMPLKEKRDQLLESLLDLGEAAVISLAREQQTALVLIDERKARKVARDIYGLQPIGTARILVEAKKKNLLPDIASQFQKLQQEGYWIHASIVEAALRKPERPDGSGHGSQRKLCRTISGRRIQDAEAAKTHRDRNFCFPSDAHLLCGSPRSPRLCVYRVHARLKCSNHLDDQSRGVVATGIFHRSFHQQ